MDNPFFGQFLVANGALSSEGLESAILYQKQNNKLLGELAVEKNMLSRQQVFDCLYLQRKTRKKFGRIALDKEYLTEEQLSNLLACQAENHIFIGEAIVSQGLMSGDRMSSLLSEYKQQVLDLEIKLHQTMAGIPDMSMVAVTVAVVRDALFQLGFVSRLSEVTRGLNISGEATKNLFTAEQKLQGRVASIGLACTDSMLDMISRVVLGDLEEDTTYRMYEVMNDLIAQINETSCQEISKLNIPAKPGAVKNIPPSYKEGWTFTIKTMPYTMYFIYFP